MSRYGIYNCFPCSYTGVTQEWCLYTWCIEKFSLHTSSGQRTASPIFKTNFSERKWRLEIFIEKQFDGDGKSEDFIKLYLKKEDVYIYKQFVKVHFSILNRFELPWYYVVKEFVFDSCKNRELLLSVSKVILMDSLCGLRRRLVLANDILTVMCNLEVDEERTGIPCTFRGYFDISRFPVWGGDRISHLVTSNTKLILELRVEDYPCNDSFVVYLKRESVNHEKQFVKVDISIVDRFGHGGWESKSKQILFDARSNRAEVLCIPKKHLMERFCGLYKLLLLQNNILTVKCDTIIYEDEAATSFDSKED